MRSDVLNTKPTYYQNFTSAKTLEEANLEADASVYEGYTPQDWGVKRADQAYIRDNQLVLAMDKRDEPKVFRGSPDKERWHNTAWVRQRNVGTFANGAVIVRAKIPSCYPGFWAGAWMLFNERPDNTRALGEADIAEAWGPLGANPDPRAVGYPNRFLSSVHYDTHNHADSVSVRSPIMAADMSNEFHDYGLIKTDEEFIFYFDDIEVTRVNRSLKPELWDKAFPKDEPMYLLFSIQAGSSWYGRPNEDTPDHIEMVIDEITIWDFDK